MIIVDSRAPSPPPSPPLNIVLGYKSEKMEPRIEIPSKNLLYNSDRFSQTACNSQSYREVFGNNCSNILRTSSSSYFLNKISSIVFGKFYMKLIVLNVSVYRTCTLTRLDLTIRGEHNSIIFYFYFVCCVKSLALKYKVEQCNIVKPC